MYIFLDVDGVLNTEADWARKIYSLDMKCVRAFCRLIRNVPGPHIVLSSTWRCGIARDGSTAVHIDDLLEALAPAGIYELDRTAVSPDGIRSKEIDYYLRRHPQDGYIILDDDPSLFEKGKDTPQLYLTSPKTGLTEKDVDVILSLC